MSNIEGVTVDRFDRCLRLRDGRSLDTEGDELVFESVVFDTAELLSLSTIESLLSDDPLETTMLDFGWVVLVLLLVLSGGFYSVLLLAMALS